MTGPGSPGRADPDRGGRSRGGRASHLLLAAGLLLLPLAVFLQVRHHELLRYDDTTYIVENPNLQQRLNARAVARAFAQPYEANWIPLTWLSLHLNHALHGIEPAGYLLTNAALHALSTLLLFLALARMTGAVWRSAFVAAVFAVHPLHVESVAWASERKDTLSGVFWMLAMVAHARYAEAPGPARAAGVALCLGLGLLAKPMLVTLPFALLLLDYWPLGRLRREPSRARPEPVLLRRAVLEKSGLFAMVAAVGAVTYLVQRELGAMSHGNAMRLSVRLPNALLSYGWYLRDAVWPSGLAVFYPHAESALPLGAAAACGLGLLAATVLSLRAAAARPYLAVGWLWYLGTLVPVIGLVQVGMQSRADRYMYLPLVGLAIAAAWGAGDWAGARRGRRLAVAVAGGGAVAAMAVAAWLQVGCWRDTRTLYRCAIDATEDNFLAHHGLGNELLRAGRPEEAERHFLEAVRVKPRWPGAHVGLADARADQGRTSEAIRGYRRALGLAPRHGRAHLQLARSLEASGRAAEAIDHYRRALELHRGPRRAEVHARLASALGARGELEQAIDHFREAVALRPGFPEAHAGLGLALLRADRPAEARAELEHALRLGVDQVAVHEGLGAAAERLGLEAEAVRHYRDALAGSPSLWRVANNLAWILATSTDPTVRAPEEAVRLAERAVGAKGAEGAATADRANLLDTLAVAYAAAGRREDAARAAERGARIAAEGGDARAAERLRERAAAYR